MSEKQKQLENIELGVSENDYKYGFNDGDIGIFKTGRGLTEEIVREISRQKQEPAWMLDFRLEALDIFHRKPMPTWGADLSGINFDDIHYYVRPTDRSERDWNDVPEDIKRTFDRLGIPEAERKFLAGVGAQYDSEMVYHNIREDLEKIGVVFLDPESGLREHPEIFRKYFGTVIPSLDNKFAALNSAVWSGGSFVYVPKGIVVDIPLQAYFRINSQNMGQFERTLIVVEEGASVHYIEGCTAPTYSSDSLHSAVVEIIAEKNAKVRYSTIQNWSGNVYNLVTKRAVAKAGATVEWVDGNLGSKVTMKYPAVYLTGPKAHGEVLSIAFAGDGQVQDTGAKMVHAAKDTSSIITSKSISKDSGQATYRGLVKVHKQATDVRSKVVCDALLLNESSRSDTFPYIEVEEDQAVEVEHEATVSKINADQVFYLMSRGLTEQEANNMIVNGFIEPFVKQMPMEYAVELNRLIELEMEGSVG
jgi:Fe-S cluster assembly protein SufB